MGLLIAFCRACLTLYTLCGTSNWLLVMIFCAWKQPYLTYTLICNIHTSQLYTTDVCKWMLNLFSFLTRFVSISITSSESAVTLSSLLSVLRISPWTPTISPISTKSYITIENIQMSSLHDAVYSHNCTLAWNRRCKALFQAGNQMLGHKIFCIMWGRCYHYRCFQRHSQWTACKINKQINAARRT